MEVTVEQTIYSVEVGLSGAVASVEVDMAGAQGQKGDDGDDGADGVSVVSAAFVGDDMVFTMSDATTVTIVGAKPLLNGDTGAIGPAGADGEDGKTWYSGTGDPTTEGVDGDFYLNRSTWHVWEKVSSTWTDRGTIKGADGEGAGDVVGPSSATDGHIALFDTATGKLLKDAGVAPYSLPTATDSVLGGVKVGSGLSITDGVLAATGGSGTDAATVNSLVFAQTY